MKAAFQLCENSQRRFWVQGVRLSDLTGKRDNWLECILFSPSPIHPVNVSNFSATADNAGDSTSSSSDEPVFDLKNAASDAEYKTILNALKQVKFNKVKAAKLLNIDRKTLYNKLKNYEL